MHIPRFGIGLMASDVPATVAFYRDYFAFEVRQDIGWFVTLGHGDSDYEVSVVERSHESVPSAYSRAAGGAVVGLVVDDATTIFQRLRADGVPFLRELVDEPWGQRHFFVQDPTGMAIDCIEIIPADPAWMAANGLAGQVSGD
jgi:catechol 2,3-dioxygenase-like lactoylglutathione lyase family enzyme